MAILVTGGAGYIGCHVAAELLAAGRRVVILDDLSSALPDALDRINAIAPHPAELIVGDVRDHGLLDAVFSRFPIEAVIHLAGLKIPGDSVAEPLRYYDANVGGATALFAAMLHHGVERLVFSSSAAVYGPPCSNPVSEDAPLHPCNPYARTKRMIEQILDDLVAAEPGMAAISLRYFNPVGAHASNLIGENPAGAPGNLFPFIAQTAAGLREKVQVFGTDYPTPDGTGIRDYIHVVDLAKGHLAALDLLTAGAALGRNIPINLGTGRGYSVIEAIAAFSRASGREIASAPAPRRPGDVAECVADPSRAARILGWRAELGLDRMCADHWAFQVSEIERPS